MIGSIDILNTGHGHLEIVVDKSDVAKLELARRVIKDMLRRGYALFVHGEGNELHRVRRFDEKADRYVIAAGAEVEAEEPKDRTLPPLKRGRPRTRAVDISGAKVTAVGRSAGG
jgi:hypothetical protein